MFIVAHRKFFFWLTGLILAAALGAIALWGLPLGIDFTGGSLLHIDYQTERPPLTVIQEQVATVPVGAVSVRAFGDDGITIRSRTLSQEEQGAGPPALSKNAVPEGVAFPSVGPALGNPITSKALWAIAAVALLIVLYIA